MRGLLASIVLALLVSTAAALSPPSFMVFFSPGSTAITEEGDKTIEVVASVFRQRIDPLVVIMAHADGAEAQSSSIDLSPARGVAVKRRLVEFGVPADRIEIQAYADWLGLVKVAPGTAEPQNRRIELFIQ
ncbi:MAG: OmpA family protein [Rhodospirillales bacterium]|nr:OmpA family protein [Rhodospirillales bacterium]